MDRYELINTADEEEPVCTRCDNQYNDDKFCVKYCGPEHGWRAYRSTVCKSDSELEI